MALQYCLRIMILIPSVICHAVVCMLYCEQYASCWAMDGNATAWHGPGLAESSYLSEAGLCQSLSVCVAIHGKND